MRMVDLIQKKKRGEMLTKEEIVFWIQGYVAGEIPDYQSSAMTMAICFQGMTDEEMTNLTMAMMHSGDTVDLSMIEGIKVDKHSTGGVGDKTSLVVAPIVAALGGKVAKMSGRGLGHTGGTLDKLESIRGLHTNIDQATFAEIVSRIGCAIISQSANLVPADKKLYALRDVTATVESIPLIASSIMSKKLASGSDCILLDVKVGSGAFMKTEEDAIRLAKSMVAIGELCGRRTAALITQMDTPLGEAVGNLNEVLEAVHTLQGHGPKDFLEECRHLAAGLLELMDFGDEERCLAMVDRAIADGSAYEKMMQMFAAEGGDIAWLQKEAEKLVCAYQKEFVAKKSGYIVSTNTEQIGLAACLLGAGRETTEDVIDPLAGLSIRKKYGDYVECGEVLVVMHTNDEAQLEAASTLLDSAYEISEVAEREPRKLILAKVDREGVKHME